MNDKYTKQLEIVTCQGMMGKPCTQLVNKQILLEEALSIIVSQKRKISNLVTEKIYLLDTIENGEIALATAEQTILELRKAQKETR